MATSAIPKQVYVVGLYGRISQCFFILIRVKNFEIMIRDVWDENFECQVISKRGFSLVISQAIYYFADYTIRKDERTIELANNFFLFSRSVTRITCAAKRSI